MCDECIDSELTSFRCGGHYNAFVVYRGGECDVESNEERAAQIPDPDESPWE